MRSRLLSLAAPAACFGVTVAWLTFIRSRLGFEGSIGAAVTIAVLAGGWLVLEEILWRIERRRSGE